VKFDCSRMSLEDAQKLLKTEQQVRWFDRCCCICVLMNWLVAKQRMKEISVLKG
jgi:hypothetical protein